MNMHVAPAPAPHPGPLYDELQPIVQDRVTKSGRRLWYKLTVIQQPLRARACGSGPKSSADRRPVDPPPVVELRIFEGNTWQEAEQKDITFLYNANFFLFATLEHARIMAHGRIQTPAANQPPVLTGMPVSGMAYLDRPNEAGYFLFPDLSVRHEGRYRLTFNLYEETKEDKDKDPDTSDANIIAPGFANATGGSFDFRMEIKSLDFTVFSAKKFPGLAESTALSRTVAEQGCRVRIRRDVRMRRRDRPKEGAEYDNGQEEYARQKRTETPDVKPNYRARSTSGSVERTPFSAESQRRQSGADYPPQFPQTPDSAVGGGHLQFFGNATQYHPPAQPHSKPGSVPPSPSHQTSHGAHYPPVHQSPHQQLHQHGMHTQASVHHAPQQGTHQAAYPPLPPQQQTYGQTERPQAALYAPNYGQSNPSPQRETAPRDYREPAPSHYRESAHGEYRDAMPSSQLYQQPKENMLPPMMHQPTPYAPPPSTQQQPPRTTLPPLILPPISNFTKQLSAPRMGSMTSPTSDMGPSLQTMPPPKLATALPPPPSVAGSKRSRDDSRRYELDTPRYHNGAREDPQLLDDQGEPQLIYRRANGAEVLVPHDEEPRP